MYVPKIDEFKRTEVEQMKERLKSQKNIRSSFISSIDYSYDDSNKQSRNKNYLEELKRNRLINKSIQINNQDDNSLFETNTEDRKKLNYSISNAQSMENINRIKRRKLKNASSSERNIQNSDITVSIDYLKEQRMKRELEVKEYGIDYSQSSLSLLKRKRELSEIDKTLKDPRLNSA